MKGINKVSDLDTILIPINDESRHHWLLAILDVKNKILTIANSARSAQSIDEPKVKADPLTDYIKPLYRFFKKSFPQEFIEPYKA